MLFEQQNYGDNLKKAGAQIPGVHTGAPTQKYLNKVQQRITLPGAVFLGVVAVMPFLLSMLLNLFGIGRQPLPPPASSWSPRLVC